MKDCWAATDASFFEQDLGFESDDEMKKILADFQNDNINAFRLVFLDC